MPIHNLIAQPAKKTLGRKIFFSNGNRRVFANTRTKRIKPEILFLDYQRIPIIYQGVNLKAIHTISPWFTIKTDYPEIEKRITEFNERHKMKEKMVSIERDRIVCGNGLMEVIYDDLTDSIVVGTEVLDPRQMQFKTDEENNIIAWKPANAIYSHKEVEPKYIAHFVGNQVGEDHWGWGQLEPMFMMLDMWINSESAIVNSLLRHGFGKYHIKVKNDENTLTEDKLEAIGEKFEDINEMYEFVTGDNIDINEIDRSNPASSMYDYLRYWQDMFSATLGMPKILMGLGNDSNRAVGSIQLESWKREINLKQQQLSDTLKNSIYNPIVKEMGYESTDYEIIWNDWGTVDDLLKSRRLIQEFQSGIITREEYRAEMGYEKEPVGDDYFQGSASSPVELPSPSKPEEVEGGQYSFSKSYYEGLELAESQLGVKVHTLANDATSKIPEIIRENVKRINTLPKKKLPELEQILLAMYSDNKPKSWAIDRMTRLGLSAYEAERIFITELGNMRNMAQLLTYQESGLVKKKVWIASLDNKTCPTCKALHLKYSTKGIPLNEDFVIKKGELGATQDFKGKTPVAHPNCRCIINPVS